MDVTRRRLLVGVVSAASAAGAIATQVQAKTKTLIAAQVATNPLKQQTMTSNSKFQNRQIVEEFFTRLESMNIEHWLELWDDNGVQEMPYSPQGFPRKLEGKAAIRQQYSSLPKNYDSMRFVDRIVHETSDPAVFIVEYNGIITVKATGKPYNNVYCGVFTVRNKKLVRFKEYFDPMVLQAAFGTNLQENFNIR